MKKLIVLVIVLALSTACEVAVTDQDSYKITFNSNNGTGEMQSIIVENGQDIKLPLNTFTPPSSDLTFYRWNLAADGSDTSYVNNGTMTMGQSDITLYAQWKDVNSIDNIKIVGAVVVFEDQVMTLTAAKPGTAYEDIYFFKSEKVQARITLNDGNTIDRPIRWDSGNYNGDIESTYIINGEIDLSYLVVTNPDNINISMPVKVFDYTNELDKLLGVWEFSYTVGGVDYVEKFNINNYGTETAGGPTISRITNDSNNWSTSGSTRIDYNYFYASYCASVGDFTLSPYPTEYGSCYYFRFSDLENVGGTRCPILSGFYMHDSKVPTTGKKISEPVYPNVTRIWNTLSLTVNQGTSFNDVVASLDSDILVQTDESTVKRLPVTWVEGSYNPNIAGTYTIDGDIDVTGKFVTNTNNVKGRAIITVSP